MLTLENIELLELEGKENVVISFNYEGLNMEFKGQMKLDKDEWINYKESNISDDVMIQYLLHRELDYLINWLD